MYQVDDTGGRRVDDRKPEATNPKHTPGPWHVGGTGSVFNEDASVRVARETSTPEDAALIAAAPDMLSALKTVCWALADDRDGEPVNLEELKYNVVDRIIEAVEPGFDGGNTTLDEYRASEAAYIVSAALAKAEGR